jgi:hypothetical protein
MMRLLLVAVLAAGLVAPPAGAQSTVAPSVIAVMGERGLNPANSEFRDNGAPMPALPPHTVIQLPPITPSSTFESVLAQVAAGPLGRLEPGTLYRVEGTRLLIYVPTSVQGPYNVVSNPELEDHRVHGTGAAGSAIGAEHGTSPTSWAVFITPNEPEGYEWLARQDWIDVVTVSTYTQRPIDDMRVLPCDEAPFVRTFTQDRVFFASSGNAEQTSHFALNSLPNFYLVGGVDGTGSAVMKPRVPASPDATEVFYSAPVATRTFESGDRYEFQSAGPHSLTGTSRFGGTSGASPSTAGRAANLIRTAREILGDDGTRPPGLLAERGDGAVAPAAGPLADGSFTAAELAAVMHAIAVPELVGPARYYVEGYGALNTGAMAAAGPILRGEQPLPTRADDDAAHARSEELRAAKFNAVACG